MHSGESKQCITTCTEINPSTGTSDQDTILPKRNDSLLQKFDPFGVHHNDDGGKNNHGSETFGMMDTMTLDQDDSMFHSVEISTFRDIFTDEATMKWMAAAVADVTEVDLTTSTVSDEMSPDQYDPVDDVDDTVLGEFLWDALVCT